MGTTALVLGIISLLLGVFSGGSLGWLGTVVAVVGIVLGYYAKKDPDSTSMDTAGMVCSIVGLVICLGLYLACVAFVGTTVVNA